MYAELTSLKDPDVQPSWVVKVTYFNTIIPTIDWVDTSLGTTDNGTLVSDPHNPGLIDVYDTHDFMYTGLNEVEIAIYAPGNPWPSDAALAWQVVGFPTYEEIISNRGVIATTHGMWQQTLNFARKHPSLHQERGAWIELDTDTGQYVFDDWPTATSAANNMSIQPTPYPSDDPGHLYTSLLASIRIWRFLQNPRAGAVPSG